MAANAIFIKVFQIIVFYASQLLDHFQEQIYVGCLVAIQMGDYQNMDYYYQAISVPKESLPPDLIDHYPVYYCILISVQCFQLDCDGEDVIESDAELQVGEVKRQNSTESSARGKRTRRILSKSS